MRIHRRWLLVVLGLACAASAQQPPTKGRPFDQHGVERQGLGQAGSADPDTGVLKGSVSVKSTGYVTSMSGAVRPFVRWNYQLGGTQPVQAAVVLNYTLDLGELQTYAGDPTCGSGYTYVAVGVRITDAGSGDDVLRCVIEGRGASQMVVPLGFGADYRGQEICATFKPGHSYTIDAYLQVEASVYGGESLGAQGSPGGSAEASATLTVNSLRLLTLAKPWIRTTITDVYSPVHDTYDRYEQLLSTTSGRGYGTLPVRIEVSAGGRYDAQQSGVAINGSPAQFRSVSGTGLTVTPSASGASLQLPDCFSLPLEGRTWRFIASFDPEFVPPREELGIGPPLLRPVFETMFGLGGLERAAGLTPPSAVHFAADRPVAATRPATLTARQFYNPANWYAVLPAAWLAPSRKTAPAAGKPTTLDVQLYVPPGRPAPSLTTPGLKVQRLTRLSFAGAAPEFTTEPVVLVSVLALWQQLCRVQLPDGLSLCANPPFIQLVERLATDAEAWRTHLDSLYLKGPDGQLYKLTDLDEERPTLAVGNPDDPTPIWLPRRVRHWLRRAAVLGSAAKLLAESRPTQEHQVAVSGQVRNTAGQTDRSQSQRAYHVVLDVVPRPQPWPLPAISAGLP